MHWYQITNKKLIIILVISVLWVIAGLVLYALVGVNHGPKGGLDSIANAIVYVFIWRLLTYAPPALFAAGGTFLWLWQNHRKAFFLVIAGIVVVIALIIVYNTVIKKAISTPKRVAAHTESYQEWSRKELSYDLYEDRTESDLVCEYIEDLVYDTLSEFRSLHEDEVALRTSYIDAAMEAHYKELPHVEGWEYIPDIRKIVRSGAQSDEKFLLSNSDFRKAAEHYGRTLNRDHWYDRYSSSKGSHIAEFFSWLPMMAVFYDDGGMDIVIVN